MSYGYAFHETERLSDTRSDELASTFTDEPRTRHLRDGVAMPSVLHALAEWLPRLGTVLWIDRREVVSPTHAASTHGKGLMLLEHSAASALARCPAMRAYSAVTPQGPREWLCLHDDQREVVAKLFLLPDTDCLAWDQMTTANALTPSEPSISEAAAHTTLLRRVLHCFGHRWQARLLHFDLRQLPWLQTMNAHPPMRISLLGLDVARAIVRNENAEWASPRNIG